MSTIFSNDILWKPVNAQAAMMLAKTPWWAQVPEDAKKVLLGKTGELSAFVSVTRQPPAGVENRIGQRYGRVVVIGYADHNARAHPKLKRTVKPAYWVGPWDTRRVHKLETVRERFWWVVCLVCGQVERTNNAALNRKAREGWPCSECYKREQYLDFFKKEMPVPAGRVNLAAEGGALVIVQK